MTSLLVFLCEAIGRDLGVEFDLAEIPLFIGSASLDLGHPVGKVEPANTLIVLEDPAKIYIR